MKNKLFLHNLMLLLAAFIWGTAFVAQIMGMTYIGPFTFAAVRYVIGTLSIFIFTCLVDALKKDSSPSNHNGKFQKTCGEWKDSLLGGSICGCMLFIASSLQQTGLQYTQAGKAGFITSMYIVLIPIYRLFGGKRTNARAWFAIFMSVIGLYLLSVKSSYFTMQKGDFLVFAGAFFWAGQILCCDIFTVNSDPLKLSCIQFASTALMSIAAMLLFETPSMSAIIKSIYPLTYVGLFSTAIAFTLQMVGQKGNDPVNASLIFCLESIFAVLSGYLILKEILTMREIIGCAILFLAIVTVQLPDRNTKSLKT